MQIIRWCVPVSHVEPAESMGVWGWVFECAGVSVVITSIITFEYSKDDFFVEILFMKLAPSNILVFGKNPFAFAHVGSPASVATYSSEGDAMPAFRGLHKRWACSTGGISIHLFYI